MPDLLVENLCQIYQGLEKKQTELDQKALACLLKKKINPNTLQIPLDVSKTSYEEHHSLELLFKATLIAILSKTSTTQLEDFWNELASQKKGDSLLSDLYLQLLANLLNIKYNSPLEVEQTQEGRLKLSQKGYWNVLKHPSASNHIDAALLLMLFGKVSQQRKWIEMGVKAAKWHLIGLCRKFLPYRGFFNNYQEKSYAHFVAKFATLFHLASLAAEDTELAFIAKTQFTYLSTLEESQQKTVSFDQLLQLRWIDHLFPQQLTPVEPHLDHTSCSPAYGYVSHHDEQIDFFITLEGCNSSMGTIKCGDLEITAFGPQLNPLGEGKFFGIIPEKDHQEKVIFHRPGSFTLKGLVALPNQEAEQEELWQIPRGWLDVKMKYQTDHFDISLKPLNVKYPLSFVFYVKAEQCLIKGQKKFLNHCLEQYQGSISSIAFLDRNQIITLEPSWSEGAMRIIPLEGKNSFLGASYLVAYSLEQNDPSWSWSVKRSYR